MVLPAFSRNFGSPVIRIEGFIVAGESENGYAGSVSVRGNDPGCSSDPMVDEIGTLHDAIAGASPLP
ncbi:MAG: hypothetical protein GKC06_07735 [Methanomicrobiales archaeon]|nr:hypothetical protein [Methanomicrobiales archaeon]